MTLRVISYGGGVQSTALVVLAATGRLDEVMGGPVDAALFANVGDDSEHPDTLAYVRQVAIPWATRQGFPIHELSKTPDRGRFAGQTETLYKRLTHPEASSVGIPVRLSTGAPAMRACTSDFKIRVVARWLKQQGATTDDPALCAVGISTDEGHRANTTKDPDPVTVITYPLLGLGLSRADCAIAISNAGLPVPPKSACYFCPLHTPAAWSDLRRDRPDLFDKAAALETSMNAKRVAAGKDPVWFTRYLQPLASVITATQDGLFSTDDWADGDGCESGHCWT